MQSSSKALLRKQVSDYKTLSLSWEGTTEALLLLVVALIVGLASGAVHCWEYSRCHSAGTCSNASRWRMNTELSCSYTNFVSVSGDVLYGHLNNTNYLDLTRSICSPGERLHINSVSGRSECAPWRSWPSALNSEIMQPGATKMHDQMCGAWIDAGPIAPQSIRYWSFYDGINENAAVENADRALYSSSRLSATDMGKFYTSCQQAILGGSGAIRASGKEAYAHLKTRLSGITTKTRVLEAAGWLASHHCDGPVLVGITVDGSTYKATAYKGSDFTSGTLAEALYAVDEGVSLQNNAEAGNNLVNSNARSSPMVAISDLDAVFEGATLRTDHANVPLKYGVTPELDALAYVADIGNFDAANGYLHGVAAMCAFALQGALDINAAAEWTLRGADMQRLRNSKAPATALGRLGGNGGAPLTLDPDNETLAQASTVAWSQLKAQPHGDAQRDCPAIARFLFPDRLDEEHFGLILTPKLHKRIEEVSDILQHHVAEVVVNHPNVTAMLVDASAVAAKVHSTRVRLAGAPRGTWGAIARDYADGHLDSGDGPMIMALKQSRAIFMDRISILFNNDNVCTGPPVYDALEQNAYIYPGGDCTHMMLGVLRKPFADERYDNVSLATRAGYVLAHELAHNTLVTDWYEEATQSLLSRYTRNLWSEAIADVISALAIVESGLATAREVCHHISQLWCARVPMTWSAEDTDTHPGPNERGDLLCQTLKDLGHVV